MASASQSFIRLPPLAGRKMAELVARAKRIGLEPADYARQLVEDGLALQRQAEKTSFAEMMQPVRRSAGEIDESAIVRLVEKARGGFPHRVRAKKR